MLWMGHGDIPQNEVQTCARLRGAFNSLKTSLKSLQLIFNFCLADVFRKISKRVAFSLRKTTDLSSK